MKLVVPFLCCALGAFGSTVFPHATITVTGTPYTVTVSADDTTGADMAGMIITANFGVGGELTCTWTAAGNCVNGAGRFNVTYPAGTSTFPALFGGGANWTITNTWAGSTLSSITFDGIPGLIAFDRCMTGASTFDDSDPSPLSCAFSTEGTANSNVGFSVSSGSSGGTANITGTVQYTNALHLAAAAPVGDLWGRFTITFGGSQAFGNGNTFTFRTDTDELGSAVSDVVSTPEPSTFGLLGFALLAIGVKLKRR